jgi:hypothetical protein
MELSEGLNSLQTRKDAEMDTRGVLKVRSLVVICHTLV